MSEEATSLSKRLLTVFAKRKSYWGWVDEQTRPLYPALHCYKNLANPPLASGSFERGGKVVVLNCDLAGVFQRCARAGGHPGRCEGRPAHHKGHRLPVAHHLTSCPRVDHHPETVLVVAIREVGAGKGVTTPQAPRGWAGASTWWTSTRGYTRTGHTGRSA